MFWNYDLNKLVRADHALRRIDTLVSFAAMAAGFGDLHTEVGRQGYGVEAGIRCLFVQFYYDLSDRETEIRLQDDMAVRWFCGFSLEQPTPDHTYFCRMRRTVGTKRIAALFGQIREKAKSAGVLRSVFAFSDSRAIVAKEATWAERDKALAAGESALNNDNIDQYGADRDARFGCKGTDKFWYGYKEHLSVDMGSGLIQAVAVTPANITDAAGFKHICPRQGMVFADKAYCGGMAQLVMGSRGVHSGAIMKKDMKKKNRDRDRWLTKMRAPYEGVFSQRSRRTRYRGLAKVQMQAFMEALVFNIKRLVSLAVGPLWQAA